MLPLILDDNFLRRFLHADTELAMSDVEIIGQLAFLTAEIDLDEDRDEHRMLDALNRSLWQLIGRDPEPIIVISPLPIDREERARWIRELVPQLTSDDAREIAYVAAYLTAVVDIELAPRESELLTELQRALDIEPDRADELVRTAAQALTPPESAVTTDDDTAAAARPRSA